MRMYLLRNTSIKSKQMSIIMLTTGVALLLACGAFVSYELLTFRQDMTRSVVVLARTIASNSVGALTFNDPPQAERLLEAVLEDKAEVVAACIYDEAGEPFAVYRRDPAKDFAPPPLTGDGHRFGRDRLEVFHQITWDEDGVGRAAIGAVYIESDLSLMYARLQRYASIMAIGLFASLLVALLLSSLLQRVISGPIVHLVETAREVSSRKDYRLRARKHGEDELGVLVDGFNEMLEQIQTRDLALQKAQGELEKRVEERTEALQLEIAERRRAEQALQQQFTRLSLLNQITRAVSERQDLKSIVQVVLQQLEMHLNIELGAVALFDSELARLRFEQLRFTGLAGGDLPPSGADISMAEAGLEKCCRGETLYAENAGETSSPLLKKLARAGVRSVIAAPMMIENRLLGILLAGRRAERSFSSGEGEFLRMLGEQVALAARQAQLYTQLQSAYNELRQTQQAVTQQERLRALGQMASGIAHDINNALSPVVVYSELLSRREPNLSDTAQKYLDHIQTAGEDIAQIVARMREFYRQRDEREQLCPINLNALSRQVTDLTRPRWRDIPQQRGVVIQMQMEFSDDLPEILGNHSELREALTNLLLNAVDAMPAGGTLTLRTYTARLKGRDPRQHAILEVQDSGIGMDEATRARCLEPFFTTKGQRGTGLGLAMVYGIMERHEADIEVESQPGRGTTFRLVFPVASAIPASSQAAPDGKFQVQPLRILCVDDEPLLRQMLQEMLETEGHTVVTADGGRAGIERFRSAKEEGQPFDLVITDLGMPYVDGRQVAFTIRKEAPQTPIVLLTGWGAMIKAESELAPHVDATLSKPPRIKELRETLWTLTTPPRIPSDPPDQSD